MAHGSARLLGLIMVSLSALPAAAQSPVRVTFHEPKSDFVQVVMPLDPVVRINLQPNANMMFGLATEQGQPMCNGVIRPSFRIDERSVYPNVANGAVGRVFIGGIRKVGAPGEAKPHTSEYTFENVHFTQTLQVVPSKPADPNAKRLQNTVLIKYTVENKDVKTRKVGIRNRMDAFFIDNDGALFAAPTTHPGKILDGVELKGKTLPDYVQILQRADLKNPGQVGYYTLKLGGAMIGPDRFLCTWHGAGDDGWNCPVMGAMGDSDAVVYWDPREIPPGGKMTFAYAFGMGIATMPESEGRLKISFAGSFEPQKTFTIQAYVEDPVASQTLHLELPEGMRRVEGREIQPVPNGEEGRATSLVIWKCQVERLGDFTIKIKASNGQTQSRTVSVAAN